MGYLLKFSPTSKLRYYIVYYMTSAKKANYYFTYPAINEITTQELASFKRTAAGEESIKYLKTIHFRIPEFST